MAKKKVDPCIYNDVIVTEDFTRAIVQNDKLLFGLIELPSAKELTPFKYINMSKFSSNRSVVYVDGKYGAIDLDGKEIIVPMYEGLTSFYNDRARAIRNGKAGIIDVQGNVIVDFIYDKLPYEYDMEKGVIPMVKDGLHGALDMDGKVIVPFIYDYCNIKIEYLDKYYIYAVKGEEKTLYDMEGNKLLSCKYEWVEYYKGYISASEDGLKYGVLDLQGKVLVPFEYSQYFNLDKERGIFVMRSANSFSIKNEMVTTTLFDLDGKKLMHIPYDAILKSDGIYVNNGQYGRKRNIGLYDYNGKILIPPVNEILEHIEDKRYLVQERGQDVAYVLDLVTGKTTELPYKLFESVSVYENTDWFYTVTSNGKYGIINKKLEVAVPIIYDKIEYIICNKKYFEVTLDGKMGVIDTKGKVVIPFEYEKIDCLVGIEYARIKSKRKFGYYNIETGTETFFTFADNYPEIYPEKGFVVRKKNKYGFLDWTGNALGLPPETCEQKPKKKKIPTPICPFTDVQNFCEGFAAVQIGDKWGYIDTKGNLIHPITLEEAYDFENGHARVYGGKGLYINIKGEYDGYIDCRRFVYSRTPRGEHGYIYSKEEDNKVGWVDYAGKEVIPCIYDFTDRYGSYISLEDENQYIIVCLNNKYGIFNLSGKVILELEHDRVYKLDGLWESCINNKMALFAEDGRRLTPNKYDHISDFKGDILKVEADGKYGFINKEGQEVVPIIYDDVKISSQGNYVTLLLKQNYSMVTSDGKEICQLKYDSIDAINEKVGLASVYKNNYYGFIDTKGNEIIPLKYRFAEEFRGEYARVNASFGFDSNQCGLINAKGEEVVPLQYNYVGDFVNKELGIISVGDEKNVGIYDIFNKKELIAPKYASCGKYSDGWLAVKSRGKWGFVDLEGNPLDYEWLKNKNK